MLMHDEDNPLHHLIPPSLDLFLAVHPSLCILQDALIIGHTTNGNTEPQMGRCTPMWADGT
jgi:hypothetical protein